MAELADAQRSGRCLRDQVQVRILLGALLKQLESFRERGIPLNQRLTRFFFFYIHRKT